MHIPILTPVLISLFSGPGHALPGHVAPRTAPLTQSCGAEVSKNPGWAYYSANVGVIYNEGSGCSDIENHISGLIGPAPSILCGLGGAGPRGARSVCSYRCLSADDGASTLLEFEVPAGHGDHVNKALNDMYPMIREGFDCPNIEG